MMYSGALTLRCSRDCACEQKYKWHRLLAYDPNNDCAGVFMDWFLFPSCCVCRSDMNQSSHLMLIISALQVQQKSVSWVNTLRMT